MRIPVSCDSCSNEFSASENAAGKRVRCPACGEPVRVPLDAGDEDVPRSSRSKGRKGKKQAASSGNSSAVMGLAIGGGGVAVIGLLAVMLMNNRGATPPAAGNPVSPMAATAPTTPAIPGGAPGMAIPTAPNMGGAAAPGGQVPPAHGAAVPPASTLTLGTQPANNLPMAATIPTGAANGNPVVKTLGAEPAVNSVAVNKPIVTADDDDPVPTQDLPMVELNKKVEKSVVRIIVKAEQGASVGSGFVINTDGSIVTNYHVIEGAVSAEVQFENGDKYPVAGFTVVDKELDLAVIKINVDPGKLSRLRIAKALPSKGETVAAFGAPRGLSFTTSNGIISAIRNSADFKVRSAGTYLQTTTPISPGNSGGPLVNMRGEVVGVNSFKMEGENLNFAVSCLDIEGFVAKGAGVAMAPLSPSALPQVFTRDNPFSRAENIARTTKGNMLLGNINDAVILMLPFAVDPTGTITDFVDKQIAKNLIGKAKWTQVTRGSQVKKSTAVVVALIYFVADEKNPAAVELKCNLQIVARDVDKDGIDYIAIVYDENRSMGKISINSLASGTIPNGMKKEIPEFFTKIVQDYRKAQRGNAASQSE